MTDEAAERAVEAVFRDEWGRVTAALVRDLRDFDLVEDAVQEALLTALAVWPTDGIPDRPGAWIHTTARRKAIDRVRRDANRGRKQELRARLEATVPADPGPEEGSTVIADDQLRLIFTCCHPALATDAQVALTLRSLCGLSTVEIARGFVVPEPTMAQRLVRARRKIRVAGIPFRVPPDHLLPERLDTVLTVVYLVFNEGYAAAGGDRYIRDELCEEAVRLARLVAALMPDEPEALGLLGLVLLTDARRAARRDGEGRAVLLPDQDRDPWDAALIAEGLEVVVRALRRQQPGRFQLQAAIAAVHAEAESYDVTDWAQIVALYETLLRTAPTPVIALNRAVALAMWQGPEVGLRGLDDLGTDATLAAYPYFHSARADLLRRVGRDDEAMEAYQQALALTVNEPDRAFLEGRVAELSVAH